MSSQLSVLVRLKGLLQMDQIVVVLVLLDRRRRDVVITVFCLLAAS